MIEDIYAVVQAHIIAAILLNLEVMHSQETKFWSQCK